jgi:hypothetical protein
MTRRTRGVLGAVPLIALLAFELGRRGEFRRQAEEARARLDGAVEAAPQIAEDAATRTDALDAVVNDLKDAKDEQ